MMRFFTATGNEARKGLWFAWAERVQIALELPFFVLFILLFAPVLGAGHQIAAGHLHWSLNSGRISQLVIVMVPAMFFYFQAVKLFWRLLAEIQSGTIEQVYLSPLPSWVVAVAGRIVAALIETLILTGALYGIVSAFVPLHLHWAPAAIIPATFLVFTAIGYSLIIGGMTLIWKRIQFMQEVILLLVIVFAIAAVPALSVPGWFTGVSRLFPVTPAVASLYQVMIAHHGVTGPWGTGGLVWVAVTAAAYLTIGIGVFRLGERTAKTRGTLGSY